MINNPKFSIVTITFNAAKDLEPTIKSIIEQDYDNIEYLIIDGGSKDDTLKIAEKYSTNIDYIVSGKDNGLYDAMNKGLRAATGDYIWFINAGDALHSPFVIREIVAQLKDKNELPTVIYGETAIIDENRRFIGMRRLKAPEKLTWRSFMMGMLVCHQSFIVRKDIAGEYDLTYRFSSDFDWCIRAMRQKGEILNSKLILSDYLLEGLTTKNRKASLKERFRIMCKYYGLPTTTVLHFWFAFRTFVARVTGENS